MTPFERSEVTDRLIRYLAQHDKGTLISYAELTQIAGTPIDASTPKLVSARKVLQSTHAQVWGCVRPGVGLYRLNDWEIAERQNQWWLPGARNKLANGSRQAKTVELRHLDITQQARFAVDSVVRELGREALSRRMHRRVERVARGTSNDLPTFSAVEWMISLSPPRPPK
jgi:hypothetical protein